MPHNYTWTTWNTTTTTSTTTAYSDMVICGGGGGSASITTNSYYVWNCWTTGNPYTVQKSPTIPTPEEQLAAQERSLEYLRDKEKRESDRKEARNKSLIILLDNLSQEQKDSYEKDKFFVVKGKSGKRYAIMHLRNDAVTANIIVLKDKVSNDNDPIKNIDYRICAHANDVPIGDQLLSQKLMLENCEEEFLNVSNKHTPNSFTLQRAA